MWESIQPLTKKNYCWNFRCKCFDYVFAQNKCKHLHILHKSLPTHEKIQKLSNEPEVEDKEVREQYVEQLIDRIIDGDMSEMEDPVYSTEEDAMYSAFEILNGNRLSKNCQSTTIDGPDQLDDIDVHGINEKTPEVAEPPYGSK